MLQLPRVLLALGNVMHDGLGWKIPSTHKGSRGRFLQNLAALLRSTLNFMPILPLPVYQSTPCRNAESWVEYHWPSFILHLGSPRSP